MRQWLTLAGFVGGLAAATTGGCGSSDADDSANVGGSDAGTAVGGSGGSAEVPAGAGQANGGAAGDDAGTAGSSGSDQGGAAGAGGGGDRECSPLPPSSGCAGSIVDRRSASALDVYILFDQSGSMSDVVSGGTSTRLDEVRRALDGFLRDPRSAGLNVAIGYFGSDPIGEASCDPLDYTTPAVPFGSLPAQANSILDSLSSIEPIGETPTPAALEGTCRYLRAWSQAHPDHETVILLVTDGEPRAPVTSQTGTCAPTLEQAEIAAAACAEGVGSIRTLVLGVGPFLSNLDRIAAAGQTDAAYLSEDGAEPVLATLNRMRGALPTCQLRLPQPPEPLDHSQLNLVASEGSCEGDVLQRVQGESACDPVNGGWFYPTWPNPDWVRLCPASCESLRESGLQLLFQTGCATYVAP